MLSGLVAIAALTTFVHCSDDGASATPGPSCPESTAQALQAVGLRGTSLPAKAVALTFDDGPGKRTKALSTYLKNEGIEAAFFVNGSFMFDPTGAAATLQQLVADGHLVANHTETHASLTGTATATARPADDVVLKELADTDAKIAPYVTGNRFLFRPPYGDFDEQTFTSLSGTAMNKYVGPVLWDVGDRFDAAAGLVTDIACWQGTPRISVETCGDMYITELKRNGKGIVLMHDPYFDDSDPQLRGTVDMVEYIVPKLKAEGFTFVRVDKVPEIASLLPPLPTEPGGDGGTSTPADGGTSGSTAPTPPGSDPCP